MNRLLLWGGSIMLVAAVLALGLIWSASATIPIGFYFERTIE